MLRFRLPTESPEAWSLIGAGLFSGLWNVVVILLAVNVGIDIAGGRADVWLLGLLAPFTIVGLASIVLFFRQLLFLRLSAQPMLRFRVIPYALEINTRFFCHRPAQFPFVD